MKIYKLIGLLITILNLQAMEQMDWESTGKTDMEKVPKEIKQEELFPKIFWAYIQDATTYKDLMKKITNFSKISKEYKEFTKNEVGGEIIEKKLEQLEELEQMEWDRLQALIKELGMQITINKTNISSDWGTNGYYGGYES